METRTYPKASLLDLACHGCENGKPESGGYRTRKHRDVNGIREVKVLRVRCRTCKRSMGCVYPHGVMRYKWYSSKVEGIFAILAVHQANEARIDDLAEHLGYAITRKTRAAWQATRAFRANQLEKLDVKAETINVASIDEMRLGYWWVYTLTDCASQAIAGYSICESRDEEVVRELIAEHTPDAIISDGCVSIKAACNYFADIPHGRCWFHVIRDVLKQFPRDERSRPAFDLHYLYGLTKIEDAEWFLEVLIQRYGTQKLTPLTEAWQQLRLYWQTEQMPLTNNTSETLYSAIWSRSKKRVVKTLDRARDWFAEARWRWHHHLVRGFSPWQRFSGKPSKPWLPLLITPLRYSTDF